MPIEYLGVVPKKHGPGDITAAYHVVWLDIRADYEDRRSLGFEASASGMYSGGGGWVPGGGGEESFDHIKSQWLTALPVAFYVTIGGLLWNKGILSLLCSRVTATGWPIKTPPPRHRTAHNPSPIVIRSRTPAGAVIDSVATMLHAALVYNSGSGSSARDM
ncbi:hypothetical protein CPLU01_08659 [Colletotrichum plurivorum]|uniref:Uncharacterized protein n=1 Tax=Colletotrichum plurivorum TaxID=2175906 RepID=A0A8H6KBR2_9PEZI|nr:hypothetical protein CPLU01_08659 [Colletotrichum plurivorum]